MRGGTRAVGVLALALVGCASFTGIEDEPNASSTGSDDASAGPRAGPNDSTTSNSDSDSDSGSQGSTGASATSSMTASASDSSDTESTTADADTSSGTSEPTESDTTQGLDSDTMRPETTGGEVCVEQDTEPNDAFDDRQDLGVQACGAAPSTASGTLLDEDDIDYFWFQSPWSAVDCGPLEPNRGYSVAGPVEVCVAVDCPGFLGTLTCPDGAFEAFDGYNFCCATGSFDIDIVCDTVDESTVGFVRVRPDSKAPACADYSFTYEVFFD